MCPKQLNTEQGPDTQGKVTGPCFNLKAVIKGLLVALCVTIVFIVAEWAGDRAKWLSPWEQAMDSYKLTDFYFWAHSGPENISHNGAGVVTIDISGLYDRNDIIDLINKINEADPLVVGVDVIFPYIASSDKAENDSLVAAFSRVKNLVLAREHRPVSGTEYQIKSSFFAKDVNAQEGCVTLSSEIVRDWSPLIVYGNDTIPSFTKVIADLAGIDMPSTTEPNIIDYSIRDNFTLKASQKWDPSFLDGQIVLIGDLEDLRDSHNIPITLNTSARDAGVNIHRQILLTAMQGKNFHIVPDWAMFLISGLLLWGFSIIIVAYAYRWEEKEQGYCEVRSIKGFLRGWVYNHAFGFAQVSLMFCSVFIGFLLFWTTGVVFEIKFLLCGFALLYAGWRFVENAPRRAKRWWTFITLLRNTLKKKLKLTKTK